MNLTVLLTYLVIQFAVQYIMYRPVRDLLFYMHSMDRNTIARIFKNKFLLKILVSLLACMFNRRTIPFIKVEFFILNILVSLFVFVFTGRGGMTGMTNTFASVILGIIMSIDYKLYCKNIISGKYYEDQEFEREVKERQKQILNGD